MDLLSNSALLILPLLSYLRRKQKARHNFSPNPPPNLHIPVLPSFWVNFSEHFQKYSIKVVPVFTGQFISSTFAPVPNCWKKQVIQFHESVLLILI